MIEGLCENISCDTIESDRTFVDWIEEQAKTWQLSYLLAHAEDGVIWGRFEGDRLITAEQVFQEFPPLRLRSLQQCRIFGEPGEILLWRAEKKWRSRLIRDIGKDFISEEQILWGTKGEEKEGFTLLSDGSEGLRHAVPLTGICFSEEKKKLHRPVRLEVRHYIKYDESGVARIFLSRLVTLKRSEDFNNHAKADR